jgi:hypothetical protein
MQDGKSCLGHGDTHVYSLRREELMIQVSVFGALDASRELVLRTQQHGLGDRNSVF